MKNKTKLSSHLFNLDEELRTGIVAHKLIMWYAVTCGRPELLTMQCVLLPDLDLKHLSCSFLCVTYSFLLREMEVTMVTWKLLVQSGRASVRLRPRKAVWRRDTTEPTSVCPC